MTIVLASRAEATVTQVDGTIVPVFTRMQQAIDTYETPIGSIDAVKDAAENPQIFRPRLSSPVVFKDIREGASFENSFGWYNIGDDVQTALGRAANLHPVMGCGVPMVSGAGDTTHHSGNPAFYVQNAEEPNSVSVNFASEATALRYKGGYIGFYLITSENNPSTDNCGDFKNGSDGKSLFGFIYFTQKDLNNDGDFVHHLVYKSKTADRFLLGFEDLFRGGDNDFEDMAMQIDGLTAPCVPSTEVCDGLDNDCDGLIDAADPDLTGTGGSCSCDGVDLPCTGGPQSGQCLDGTTACTAGALVCNPGPSGPEQCDGVDNNCNGQIDDAPIDPSIGNSCDGPDADSCAGGHIACQSGTLACTGDTGPLVEICNGFDDNCNGQTDEGDPGGGGACGSSIGVCQPGTLHCTGGSLKCQGGVAAGTETCNGLDDDCDGVVDDHLTDTGAACGTNSVGECKLGQTICVGGSLQCAGEVGPSAERCNGKDDDCNSQVDDNPIDAGGACGSTIGTCQPGTLTCSMMGTLVCTGGVPPGTEICDGLDNDCNGVVDDHVTGEGVACGSGGGGGACSGGATKCIAGVMQCVGGTGGGTEVCNGIDDDCDGLIDNGDLCAGGACDHGHCAAACLPGEFPCPSGQLCNEDGFCVTDPCSGVTCPNDVAGNLQVCKDGACIALCPTVDCPNNLVCRGTDGACVLDTCDYLPKCAANEICVEATCQPNPCNGVACPSGEFCRAGACVASCEGVRCGQNESCRDGACVATGCAQTCGSGVCNPDTGLCQINRCTGVVCPNTKVCDTVNGGCIADPCQGVTCPGEQTCAMGQCGLTPKGGLVTTGGGGGCSASGDGAGSGTWLVGLALIALVAHQRRRRVGRAVAGSPVAAIALVAGLGALTTGLGGCKINDYCLECETRDAGGGGGSGDDGGAPGDVSNATCDPNQIHVETCNGVDDNCDGNVDEGFDKQTDPLNCGACGVQCNKPGAQTKCIAGACTITGCFPGFSDRDGDITAPYPMSNGCEYLCFPSNSGVEACDGLDNDCNGVVDEGYDKQNDPSNCGACGRVCQFFGAAGHCSSGACSFNPATDCQAGFYDIDGVQANGCEYSCTPSNGGVESCDLRDNDCDGLIDETFDFTGDPNNCGRCGLTCQFPHAAASCALSVCRFEPATDCQPGYYDANGNQLDGCEYQCTKTNGGVEICDGIDNDCDGVADDSPVDAGGACAATGTPTGSCVANGQLTCAQAHLVCTGATEPVQETCNNTDDDCNGSIDNGVTQACYDGAPATKNVGVCHAGVATCAAGSFGTCAGEVLPSGEQCNGFDDDCNGQIDDAAGGGAITASCYTGPGGTSGVGTCAPGTKTCAFGAFGACTGEIKPAVHDICGDGLDSDCDGKGDAAEGCQVLDAELRLDSGGGTNGEASAGANHSYDIVLARGGVPLGTNVYAAWSELVSGTTYVYFRSSTDGGTTWGTTVNITAGIKPAIAVAPGATDKLVLVYQTVTGGVRDLFARTSADAGATWSAASAQLDGAGDSFHHVVAISGTTCAVAWEKLDTSTLNRDIQSRTSTTSCTAFNAETKINSGSGTRFAGRPQVAITSGNGIVWAWREQRTGTTRDIYAASAASAAGAATVVAIDTDTANESDFPVLRVNEATAYLTWQNVATSANNGSDVLFARSSDGGGTWTTAKIIDDPVTEVSSSFTPSLAIDPLAAGVADDLVAIAWEDRRQGSQVFVSVSSDGGTTFAAPVRASSDVGAPITGGTTVPQLAAPGGGVLAVAYQNQQTASTARPHIFLATSIDTGATWTYTQFAVDGSVGAAIQPQIVPSVVATKPAAVTAWTDFRANQVNGDVYAAVSH